MKKIFYQHFNTIDSTNAEAKRLAMQGKAQPICISATEQSAGRGRLGRTFYSPENTGLYFSVLFPIETELSDFSEITTKVCVCVWKAIQKKCHIKTQIKWVNDLYYEGKKVCGILCESVTSSDGQNCLIIGIGVNLNTSDFPSDIPIAGSLQTTISAEELKMEIMRYLLPYLLHPKKQGWYSVYKKNSLIIGKNVQYVQNNEQKEGLVKDITKQGHLLIEKDGELNEVSCGEATFHI